LFIFGTKTLCFRYEGDKVKGLYDGKGVAYFTGGHSYKVFIAAYVCSLWWFD